MKVKSVKQLIIMAILAIIICITLQWLSGCYMSVDHFVVEDNWCMSQCSMIYPEASSAEWQGFDGYLQKDRCLCCFTIAPDRVEEICVTNYFPLF